TGRVARSPRTSSPIAWGRWLTSSPARPRRCWRGRRTTSRSGRPRSCAGRATRFRPRPGRTASSPSSPATRARSPCHRSSPRNPPKLPHDDPRSPGSILVLICPAAIGTFLLVLGDFRPAGEADGRAVLFILVVPVVGAVFQPHLLCLGEQGGRLVGVLGRD